MSPYLERIISKALFYIVMSGSNLGTRIRRPIIIYFGTFGGLSCTLMATIMCVIMAWLFCAISWHFFPNAAEVQEFLALFVISPSLS